jgi:hypothetical protein
MDADLFFAERFDRRGEQNANDSKETDGQTKHDHKLEGTRHNAFLVGEVGVRYP